MTRVVGPVLIAGRTAEAVIAAIREENEQVETVDRGSYIRVLCPGECRLTRAAVERQLGAPFALPADLERVMASFQGRLEVDEDQARWWGGPR
jgi:hypothetical protein